MANLRRWIVSLCTRRKAGATEREWKNIRISFSQFGEDLILQHLLPDKGFYIDVGANHPVTHSNTWLFYQNGWRGITVEPNPELADLHRVRRPRDMVLAAAVGRKRGCGALVRGDSHLTNRVKPLPPRRREKESETIPILTLGQILLKHLSPGTEVDLLNVDCEGMDLDVLAGNDWKKCRPKVICAEAKTRLEEKTLTGFLRQKGYNPHARVFYSLIFLRQDWEKSQFPELAKSAGAA